MLGYKLGAWLGEVEVGQIVGSSLGLLLGKSLGLSLGARVGILEGY